MNKILSTTLCFGFLTLLSVMIFLEMVHGRPYLTQGNELFPAKEDTNSKELLLDLLNTNFDFQRPSNVGIELANKLEELNQPAFGNTVSEVFFSGYKKRRTLEKRNTSTYYCLKIEAILSIK
ncbi:urotensin-2B isoform X3 [Canis aureus]